MLHRFEPQRELDIAGLSAFNDELRHILLLMDEAEILTDVGYSQVEFQGLISSFVEGQRGSLGRTKPGSWSIVPDDIGMDADARVEFIFTPTYLVTAILTRTRCDYPAIAESVPGFVDALKAGMLFCSHRKLYGHGYEAWQGAVEALTILSMGKVPQELERDRHLCPKLFSAIVDATKEMHAALSGNAAFGMWGESLQEEYSSALETLCIKNDREAFDAIMRASEDSELFSEEDLPW